MSLDERRWRRFREPFPLTDTMTSYHTCQWELIDIDKAGCTLCGAIHRCKDGRCQLIQTEDAEVCHVTGFCVRDKMFAETEFSDTVASYNMGQKMDERQNGVDRLTVQKYAEQLLMSKNSESAYVMELTRFRGKLGSQIQHEINTTKGKPVNLVHVIEHVLRSLHGSRILKPRYSKHQCKRVLQQCVDFICFIINTCIFYFKMSTRSSEMRVLVYGLLYLMRSGVVVNSIQVIPKVQALFSLLPAENTLQNVHNFRPKFITDVENKFKFMFRSMSFDKLRVLGEHSRKTIVRMVANDSSSED